MTWLIVALVIALCTAVHQWIWYRRCFYLTNCYGWQVTGGEWLGAWSCLRLRHWSNDNSLSIRRAWQWQKRNREFVDWLPRYQNTRKGYDWQGRIATVVETSSSPNTELLNALHSITGGTNANYMIRRASAALAAANFMDYAGGVCIVCGRWKQDDEGQLDHHGQWHCEKHRSVDR